MSLQVCGTSPIRTLSISPEPSFSIEFRQVCCFKGLIEMKQQRSYVLREAILGICLRFVYIIFLMKLAFGLLFVTSPISVFASFEMNLILERNGGLGQVRRYDPVNNVNLGTFGFGTMGPGRAIALNQSINTAYVLDQMGSNTVVHRYNYNTGEFRGSFIASGISGAREIEVAPNGELMIAGIRSGLSSVHTFSESGTYLSSVTFYSGNTAMDMVRLADGRTLAAGYRPFGSIVEYYMTAYAANGSAIGYTFLGSAPLTQEQFVNAKIASLGNKLYLNAGYYNSSTGEASYSAYLTADTNPFTALSGFTPYAPLLTQPNATWMSDVAVGHDGQLWGIARRSSQGSVLEGVRWNASLLNYQYYTPNYDMNNFVDVAIVVAPEPGTILALGGGALVLLAKRKRRSKAA